jgi:hypothetical protein
VAYSIHLNHPSQIKQHPLESKGKKKRMRKEKEKRVMDTRMSSAATKGRFAEEGR